MQKIALSWHLILLWLLASRIEVSLCLRHA